MYANDTAEEGEAKRAHFHATLKRDRGHVANTFTHRITQVERAHFCRQGCPAKAAVVPREGCLPTGDA